MYLYYRGHLPPKVKLDSHYPTLRDTIPLMLPLGASMSSDINKMCGLLLVWLGASSSYTLQTTCDPPELLGPLDGSLTREGSTSIIDTKLEWGFIVINYVRHRFYGLMLEMLGMLTGMMIRKDNDDDDDWDHD